MEQEFSHLYKKYGLGTTIWSPPASGLLTGKYTDGIPSGSRLSLKEYAWLKDHYQKEGMKDKVEIVLKLHKIAKKLEISLPQLSLA